MGDWSDNCWFFSTWRPGHSLTNRTDRTVAKVADWPVWCDCNDIPWPSGAVEPAHPNASISLGLLPPGMGLCGYDGSIVSDAVMR